MTEGASRAPTAEALAQKAAQAIRQREWLTLTALLSGPLCPRLMQPVLRVLRRNPDDDPQTLSDLARTLVRRLDVGAEAAVNDLRLWSEAPTELRTARLEAWAKLSAGRRGEREAALAAPERWRTLIELEAFDVLPQQAQAVALIEAAQAHWRSARADRSITILQQAVGFGERAARVAGSLPHAAEALTVAGDAGLDLWRFAPRVGDLGRSIEHARDALARTPSDHPRRGWRAARLAGKLTNLSLHEGTMKPLDEALTLLRDAPDATADTEDRCGVLHDLSRAAGRRWQIAREPDDLETSVTAARRAVEEVPPESLDIRIMRSGLATALRRRGEATDSLKDLEEALRIRRELVALETDNPRQGMVQSNLALSLRELAKRSGRAELLDEAIETLHGVLADTDPDSEQYATRLHDLARCYRARAKGDDGKQARQTMEGALKAAADHPEVRAVIAAELGSMLVDACDRTSAARAYESALDALRELQGREDHLSDRLAQLGRVANLPANATRAALRANGGRSALSIADKGRTVVVAEIVGRPAATGGDQIHDDVLCVGAADAGGFAILVTADGTMCEECPQLTSSTVTRRVRDFSEQLARRRIEPEATNHAIEGLSSWLGSALRLEHLQLPERVAVVALGPLALLPVHLATYQDAPLCLSREVSIRLRPSRLRVPQSTREATREGIVINPASDRLEPLLLAKQEGYALGQAVTHLTPVEGPAAVREEVLAALRRADVAHFSSHARSMPDRPLDSCVFLSGNELLTVTDLLSSPTAGDLELMALTGCETATVGRRVPDESISLAAAAVVAGAQSVLSTLWPVSQIAAALICEGFYAHWRHRPERPAAALADTQRWLRDASVEELANACEELGAPVTDPAQLSRPLHWAGWTVTAA